MSEASLAVVVREAEFLGMSESWLYKMCERGLIPHARVGSKLRFEPRELQRWFDEQKHSKSRRG